MFGFSLEKFIVIAVFAIVILGPDRLPAYATKLARFATGLRRIADGAKERMRDELGPDFDDVDWKKLDPRQYDPRQIIRQALLDDRSPDHEPPGEGPPEVDASGGDALDDPNGGGAGTGAGTSISSAQPATPRGTL